MESITLRPVSAGDIDILLVWRNDPATRAASRNTEVITREIHVRWLDWRLRDPFTRMFVAEADGIPVGVVRIESENTGQLLSWIVAPEVRGRGFGMKMVEAAFALTTGAVKAEIRIENEASIKIAESLGMVRVKETDGFAHYRYEPDGFRSDPLAVLRHL